MLSIVESYVSMFYYGSWAPRYTVKWKCYCYWFSSTEVILKYFNTQAHTASKRTHLCTLTHTYNDTLLLAHFIYLFIYFSGEKRIMKISWAAVRYRDWSRALPYQFVNLNAPCQYYSYEWLRKAAQKRTETKRGELELCVASVWYRKILIAFFLIFFPLTVSFTFAYLFACITTIYRNFYRFSLWLFFGGILQQNFCPESHFS